MALSPAEIADGAKCYCIPNATPALLFLLDQIRVNGGGATMTPAEIADASKCFCIPDVNRAMLFLLDQILSNGGGGGGGGGLSGVGSPEGVVTANPGTTYLDTSTGFFYAKMTGSGNTGWLALIN